MIAIITTITIPPIPPILPILHHPMVEVVGLAAVVEAVEPHPAGKKRKESL